MLPAHSATTATSPVVECRYGRMVLHRFLRSSLHVGGVQWNWLTSGIVHAIVLSPGRGDTPPSCGAVQPGKPAGSKHPAANPDEDCFAVLRAGMMPSAVEIAQRGNSWRVAGWKAAHLRNSASGALQTAGEARWPMDIMQRIWGQGQREGSRINCGEMRAGRVPSCAERPGPSGRRWWSPGP